MDDVLVVGEALVDIVLAADGEPGRVRRAAAPPTSPSRWPGWGARSGSRPLRRRPATGACSPTHLAAAGVELACDPARARPHLDAPRPRSGRDGAASYEFDLEWRLGPVHDRSPLVVHACSLGAVLAPGADDVVALLEGLDDGVR